MLDNPYRKVIHGREGPVRSAIWADVYDVLVAFGVTSPPIQHAIKKLLCAGRRGNKSCGDDLREAMAAIERAIEMIQPEDGKSKEWAAN